MKSFFASLFLISTTAFATPISQPLTLASGASSGASIVTTSSFLQLPHTRNRSGSHRVGGRNSHGKGSHYKGGR